MTEIIKDFAEKDTPQEVSIPDSRSGLLIWAVGRFGSGIIIAIFAVWWLVRIDDRAAEREAALLDAYRNQTSINVETVAAIRANTQAINELSHEIKAR
jgi:hypothetical protein